MSEAEGAAPREVSTGRKVASALWSIGCVTIIVLFVAAVAGPKLISARALGNETSAIGALKTLAVSQTRFREQQGGSYGTLDDLAGLELIDTILASGEKQGYRFVCQPAAAQPALAWWATAAPLRPGSSGDRYFAVNQQGVVHYRADGPIAVDPETGAIPADATPVGK